MSAAVVRRAPRAVLAVLAVLAVTVLAALASLAPAAPVAAAGSVSVSGPGGGAVADVDGETVLELAGSGFQSVEGGFGGLYVFFGTVDDPRDWRPSNGGTTGEDYRYVPDSESADNAGYQRFVAFPGSDTASSANGGTLAADGTWSSDLRVPGAVFETVDRGGAAVSVDCTTVTCGVITIGAHGVVNAANESFTPVSFEQLDAEDPAQSTDGTDGPAPDAGDGATTAPTDVPSTGPSPPGTGREDAAPAPTVLPGPVGRATVEVDRATAVVGRVLTVRATGFAPGEQVVLTLDDGAAAVGPLTAGARGEVAAVLALPADAEPGTHVVRATAPASGRSPTVRFAVVADPTAVTAAVTDPADRPGSPDGRSLGFLLASAGLLGLALAAAAVLLLRRRAGVRTDRGPSLPPSTAPEGT